MVGVFQYINFKYLSLFKNANFEGLPDDEKDKKILEKIKEYNNFNYLGTIFSSALILQAASKQAFNLLATTRVNTDIWIIMDILGAILNLICFNFIGNVTKEQIKSSISKQTLDYYVIVVVVLSWLRFFSYFLVVRPISLLLNTLIKMLLNMVSFIFIITCFMLISGSIFTTLF